MRLELDPVFLEGLSKSWFFLKASPDPYPGKIHPDPQPCYRRRFEQKLCPTRNTENLIRILPFLIPCGSLFLGVNYFVQNMNNTNNDNDILSNMGNYTFR